MSKLTIVAQITAKADQVDLVKAELLKLIEPTRAEKGCIQYDLHQDNDDSANFLFFEIWENRELWQRHIENEHVVAYKKATENAVEEFALSEMTQIG